MSSEFFPWEVIHIHLENLLDPLDARPGLGGLFVVLWKEGLPLGQLVLPSALLPISVEHLKNLIVEAITPAVGQRLLGEPFRPPQPLRRRHRVAPPALNDLHALLAIKRPLETASRRATGKLSEPAHAVSLVICTRNRPHALRACLDSLRNLAVSPEEVIVVDNDPGQGQTRAVVEEYGDARWLAEPRPGLSAARNAGVLAARGDVIAFTDDDVRVHRMWLSAIRDGFRDPSVSATTGMVLPAELTTRAQFAFQMNSAGWGYRAQTFDASFFEASRRVGVPVWRIGAGANMAFRRSAFEKVGLFDERLGAGAAGCSEDSELWYRLLAAGERIRYDPAAVVHHTHRAEWRELHDQMHAYMQGHIAALLFQYDRHGHRGNLYRAFLELPAFYAWKVVGRLLRSDESGSLPLRPQIHGALMGLVYYVRRRADPPHARFSGFAAHAP